MELNCYLPLPGGKSCHYQAIGRQACQHLAHLAAIAGFDSAGSGETVSHCRICIETGGRLTLATAECRWYGSSCFDPENPKRSAGLLWRHIFYYGLLGALLPGGSLLFHGGLAVRNGRGLLVGGASGVGKSTLMRRFPVGWEVPADDAVLLSLAGGEVWCQPLPTWSIWFAGSAPEREFEAWRQWKLADVCLLVRSGGPKLEPLASSPAIAALMECTQALIGDMIRRWPAQLRRRYHCNAFAFTERLQQACPAKLLSVPLEADWAGFLAAHFPYGEEETEQRGFTGR